MSMTKEQLTKAVEEIGLDGSDKERALLRVILLHGPDDFKLLEATATPVSNLALVGLLRVNAKLRRLLAESLRYLEDDGYEGDLDGLCSAIAHTLEVR